MAVRYASWFGGDGTPLLGHLHLPDDGRARSAVVICPPLGKEHLDTYLGMKALAERLGDHGILALRFDYAGLGDSTGDQDHPEAVDAWQRSIAEAVTAVRDSGIEHISLVGLRAGALLAASALDRCGPIAGVVLWDPILSGRSLLREQRALYAVTQGDDSPDDPRISIIGGVLHPEAAAALQALKIDPVKLGDRRTLFAVRDTSRESPAVAAFADTLGGDELVLHGHEEFVTPTGLYAAVPIETIERMSVWLADGAPTETHPVDFSIRHTATVATTPAGESVLETVEYLGPNELFALRTHGVGTAGEGDDRTRPTLLFFGTAYERRTGPSRLWVELARDLAAHGISSVRFDRTGVGDTGPAPGTTPTALYSETADRDALDAARSLRVDPGDVVMTGLCSGAWYASSTAMKSGARAVVLVNMVLWSTYRRKSLRDMLSPPVPGGPENTATNGPATPPLRARIKTWAQKFLPYPLWRLLGQLGITQVPEVVLEALRRAGVATTVVLSAQDHRSFLYQRGEEGLERLGRRGFTGCVRAGETGDHGAYRRDGREFLRSEVESAVMRAFGSEISARTGIQAEREHAS